MPPRKESSDTLQDQTDATPPAPSVAETMPDEFPVDFAEWAAGQAGIYRWLVAGYRQRVREQGALVALKPREEWDQGFAAFRKEEVR